ncbi:hypothetical protein UFOVP281_13 [uncultured Caudovirales phage]|uniref:Zinc-binding loop region of homing endonuclease domain-containing protein n=1 Tax=uncultured Caudovirales phage TaxID=2100421 RepID=A0A6J5LP34_9CAUD|nr:hypothetical protein UFOVP281_13 [uncultured Caudovirales phage]
MTRCKDWYKTQPDYVEYGAWGFHENRLKSKIVAGPTEEDCTEWLGSKSPSGALMGAYRGGLQQMCQSRRLVWMMENKQDVSPYSVTLTCGNQMCCNPKHFKLKPTNRPDRKL